MTQKKKTDFKIVTPPDDLSEVRAKTKKIHREKLKKIVVPVILIALAVSGTYLMLTNKAYSEAGTAVRYSTDSSDTSNYAHFANGIVRYNRDGVVFLNKKNEEKWIQSTQLKNPIIEVKEKAFAVGDIGGNSILVFSEEGLKGEIETSLPIENMADAMVLKTAFKILKEEERQIVLLHAGAGLKHREIAQDLKIPLPTVLSKYNRAVRKLKQYLREE